MERKIRFFCANCNAHVPDGMKDRTQLLACAGEPSHHRLIIAAFAASNLVRKTSQVSPHEITKTSRLGDYRVEFEGEYRTVHSKAYSDQACLACVQQSEDAYSSLVFLQNGYTSQVRFSASVFTTWAGWSFRPMVLPLPSLRPFFLLKLRILKAAQQQPLKRLCSVAVITPDSESPSEHSGNPGSIPGTT